MHGSVVDAMGRYCMHRTRHFSENVCMASVGNLHISVAFTYRTTPASRKVIHDVDSEDRRREEIVVAVQAGPKRNLN